MPDPYWPKKKGDYLLSMAERNRSLIRVRCPYCKRVAHYHPVDLIEIYGDMDVDSLMGRMRCEAGKDHATLDVRAVLPSASEAVGIKVRRLAGIAILRRPIWRED